jgi:hypothetical protein
MPNKNNVKEDEMDRARMGEKRNAYGVLVGKPEGKGLLGRPRHRWENITINLREVGWGGVYWIHLARKRDQWRALANMVMIMKLRVP